MLGVGGARGGRDAPEGARSRAWGARRWLVSDGAEAAKLGLRRCGFSGGFGQCSTGALAPWNHGEGFGGVG